MTEENNIQNRKKQNKKTFSNRMNISKLLREELFDCDFCVMCVFDECRVQLEKMVSQVTPDKEENRSVVLS